MPNERHSSKKSDWITPPWLIEAAKKVLGRIDLDPASSARANKIVGADHYFTKRDNGLKKPWRSPVQGVAYTSIWLNPPGGWHNNVWGDSEIRYWWGKTLFEQQQGEYFGHQLWLAFSIEQLQVTQVKFSLSLLDFPTCVLSRRTNFIDPATGRPVSGMTHSQSVTYIPGRLDETDLFYKTFRGFGKVVAGYGEL